MSLDLPSHGQLPAYITLAENLRALVASLPPDAKFPTERDICEGCGHARATVRRALAVLEREGLIVRRQGSGTYVSQPRHVLDGRLLVGFNQDLGAQGAQPSSRLISIGVRPASATLVKALELGSEAAVVQLRRLRLVEDVPVAFETSSLPLGRFAALLDLDWASRSLYDSLAQLGVTPARAEEVFTAVALDAYTAELLNVRSETPALRGERLTFDGDGRPIEMVVAIMRADRIGIRTELTHSAGVHPQVQLCG